MIILHPRHSNHLCQDPDSISQTFLEQFVLVNKVRAVEQKEIFCPFNLIVTEAPLFPISYIGAQQDRGRWTLPLNSSDHRLIKDFV